ncbi:MAG: hypothetical protein O3B96_01320, partial [bacterium]|nr:hypothetical protein [bacterium]
MQKNYVVVVLNGPRLNAHGFPARGDDEGRFDPARTEKAVAVAKRLATMGEHVVVIPCGDAAPVHGEDLAEMVRLIKAAGVPCPPANNGGTNMNTFGDCAVAACNIKAFIDTGNSIGNITLVTCWYHGPRAAIQLRNALWREGIVGASVTVRSVV